MGETFRAAMRPEPRPVGGLGEGSGALESTALSLFPRPSSSHAGPRPDEPEGPGERLGSTSSHSLTTNTLPPVDRIPPLKVARRQLVDVGRAHFVLSNG